MGSQDTFRGAENAFTFFFLYLQEVARTSGMEQAMALTTRVGETLGSELGAMLKLEADVAEFNARAAATLAQNLIEERFGMLSEIIEDKPDQVAFQIRMCPVYQAARQIGLDKDTIEALCHAGPLRYMDALVKELDPRLSYRLRKFRSQADGTCEEAIVLI
jgi:hypothetical protein